jgi:hypothetical protein
MLQFTSRTAARGPNQDRKMNEFRAQASTSTAAKASASTLSGGLAAAAVIVLLAYLTFSVRPPEHLANGSAPALAQPPALAECVMDRPGFLLGQVFGSIDLRIDLQGPRLTCNGAPRPTDKGLRLFFAGRPTAGAGEVVFVLGIDGGIESLQGNERPAAITFNDESTHRFFHADAGRCFTKVSDVAVLTGPPARTFRIDGVAWCAGALPSVSDESDITLGDIHYSGRFSLDSALDAGPDPAMAAGLPRR